MLMLTVGFPESIAYDQFQRAEVAVLGSVTQDRLQQESLTIKNHRFVVVLVVLVIWLLARLVLCVEIHSLAVADRRFLF